MITIKDKALGKYSVTEDFQGFKVNDETGKPLVKVNTFEESLRYISDRLILDETATYTLAEYTKKKKEVYDAIVGAQQAGDMEQEGPQQTTINFHPDQE